MNRGRGETDWVVIKGLFFLPTEEHLHSSHLLRRDCATVCALVCVHTLALLRFICEKGWPPLPALLPSGSPGVGRFNVMQGWQPAQAAGLSDRGR